MKVVSEFDDVGRVTDLFLEQQAQATSRTMDQVRTGVIKDWRELIRASGLGTRLGNTIRGKTFPSRPSVDAAAFIWTKAPKLIGAYAFGATIVPTNGRRYLAIPTENVPLKRGGKPMSPQEVEQAFGQKLILLPRGGHLLAFVNVVQSNNRKGWRKATSRRLAQGRDVRLVLMFVFTQQVKVPKRFDLDALAADWSDRIPELIDQNWTR